MDPAPSNNWASRSNGQAYYANASHDQAFVGRRQAIGAQNARQVEHSAPLFRCTSGMFNGQTIRAEVKEIQKADVGRK